MSGHGRTLAVLGLVLAAGLGAAVWLSMGGGPSADDPASDAATDTADAASSDAAAAAASSRAKKKGTAGVFGEIRRSAGKAPVAGQEVRLAPVRGDAYVTTTDAAGAFRFTGVPHGESFELTAAAPRCGTIRIPGIALDRNEQRNVGTLWLDPSVKLVVRVLSGTDEPVEDALVEAYPIPSWVDYDWSKALAQLAAEPISVAKSASDGKGEAHFPEMAVGTWTFVASKAGFAKDGARSVTLRSAEEAEPVTIRLCAGHALDGRVTTADGKPVANALVMAGGVDTSWEFDAAPLRARAKTGADGGYALPLLGAGDVQLWVARGGGAPAVVATVRIPLISHYDLVLKEMGVIAGVVKAKDGGAPIEGVTVRATSWEQTTICAEAVTGPDGRYAIEMSAGPVNDITAEKEGLVLVHGEARFGMQRQAVVHEGETTMHDLVMTRGARLTGIVRGPDGPLAGARVLVPVGDAETGLQQIPAITGADGRYEFTSLASGSTLVVCEKEGFWLEGAPEDWWNAVVVPTASPELRVTIPESGEATHDITLKAGMTVTGTVSGPGGEPLAGARVTAPGASESAPTAADGAFRLEGAKPGSNVQLGCRKTGWVLAAAATVAVTAGASAEGASVRMMREPVVRGHVTSASGGALRDVRVVAAAIAEQEGHTAPWEDVWRWQQGTRLAVHAGGAFEGRAPYAQGENLVLRATAADCAETESKPVPFVEGQDAYDVDVVVTEGSDLEGLVRVKGGAPLAGADVSFVRQFVSDEEGATFNWNGGPGAPVAAISGADGRFRIPHVAAGNYDVKATARGYVSAQLVATVGSGAPVTLDLSPEMTIEGRVLLPDGTPVEGVDVGAGGTGAGDIELGGISTNETSATTDARGAFRIAHLAEGSYTLIASLPWRAQINVRPGRIENVAAGSKDVKLVVDAGAEIRGRVTDSRGKAIAGVSVEASPMQQVDGHWETHDGQTKADGSFAISGLGPAPHQLTVSAERSVEPSYRHARIADVTPGTKDLVIVLEEGLEISGVVTGPDDRPVAGLTLEAFRAEGDEQQERVTYAQTDSAGRFRMKGLDPGAIRIDIARWGQPNDGFVLAGNDAVPAGATDVHLTARRGASISGVVVDDAGKPLSGIWISVYPPSKPAEQRTAQSKADGTFEVGGLAEAGPFTLKAQSQKRMQFTLEKVESGARDLKVVMAMGLESSGRVTDAAGNPVKSAMVLVNGSDGQTLTVGTTGEDGRFTVSGLPAGTFDVSVVPRSGDDPAPKPCGRLRAGDVNVELRTQ